MFYIEQKYIIKPENNPEEWYQVYSYTNDHYDMAKHDIEILRNKYQSREFRLICIDNF
jgi:hypothetical protein